jgi:peptidoglycan hydrolase-like protein with peptidoglycan-binding domain
MWQYSSKEKVNGIKGNVDMNYLFEEMKLKETLPMLQKGSTGKAVKVWQIIVGVTPDGIFGNDTKKATKDFQKRNLLLVDGIVGDQSWEAGLKTLYCFI